MKVDYLHVLQLDDHESIKPQLLSMISLSKYDNKDGLTKTDFFIKENQPYKGYIQYYLDKIIVKALASKSYKILDCWFQEYKKYSYHAWHTHDCQWALVYYINLPEGSRGTVFKDNSKEEEISPNVKEGDVLIFPGRLEHKSPLNKSNKVKTVIAMNIELV